MIVILLERYRKLGNIGDVIEVKNGYARNFLLPKKIALSATKINLQEFDKRKAKLTQEFEGALGKADQIKASIELDPNLISLKQAGSDDRLYGSVTRQEIISLLRSQRGVELLSQSDVEFSTIKYLGVHEILIRVFADVQARCRLIVGRTAEEAQTLLNKLEAKQAVPQEDLSPQEKSDTSPETFPVEEDEKDSGLDSLDSDL